MSKTSLLLEYAEPMASRVAKQENVSFALFPQLPYISTARGTHTHPSSLHVGSLALCLRAFATCAGGNDVLPFLLNSSHLARFTLGPVQGLTPQSDARHAVQLGRFQLRLHHRGTKLGEEFQHTPRLHPGLIPTSRGLVQTVRDLKGHLAALQTQSGWLELLWDSWGIWIATDATSLLHVHLQNNKSPSCQCFSIHALKPWVIFSASLEHATPS